MHFDVADLVDAVRSEQPDARPLEQLRAAVDAADSVRQRADELLDHFVGVARRAGCSWGEIGGVLGVSKQAAQQRFGAGPAREQGWPPGLDEGAGAAFMRAAEEARALGHHYVRPEHLLLALIEQRDELAGRVLNELRIKPDHVRARVREQLPPSPARARGSLGVAPETKRLLELAQTLAKRLGHRCARTEHVLLAAVSPALQSPAGTILAACGADSARICQQLASRLDVEAPELAARLRQRPRFRRRRATSKA